ncbi:hypothetical protein [Escherichia phage AV124]|nr:hypothetical protein [Escherichia phage AV124]
MENNITSLIRKIRDIFPPQVDVSWVGKNGKCYQVALVLRHIFPDSEICYSPSEGHVYTKIGKVFYDIEGAHLSVPPDTTRLDHNRGHKPHRWHKSFGDIPIDKWII